VSIDAGKTGINAGGITRFATKGLVPNDESFVRDLP